jgi:hypothetical protein
LHPANKKVGKTFVSDFARWPTSKPLCNPQLKFYRWQRQVQFSQTPCSAVILAKLPESFEQSSSTLSAKKSGQEFFIHDSV